MNLRKLGWLAAVGAALAWAPIAFGQEDGAPGQGPGRGRGRGPGMGMGMRGGFGFGLTNLLENADVRKAVGVTKDQEAFLQLLRDEIREEDEKTRSKMEGLSREERMAKFGELREKMPEIMKQREKKLEEILGADKVGRLKQIQLQLQGPMMAVMNEDIRKKLNITDEQIAKFREKGMEMMRDGQSKMQEAGDDAKARQKAFSEMRKKGQEAMLGLFTDAQKKTWSEMIGEPVDIELPIPAMGPGGPGGRRPRPFGAPENGDRPRNRRNRPDAPSTDKPDSSKDQ